MDLAIFNPLGLIFIIFTLSQTFVLAVQRFDQQPSYTEVNPGQNALLICKVLNKRGTCSWQKDNKPVGMYQHKYEWAGSQQDNNDCSIRIKAAQLDFDDGNWECQITASDFHTQDALTSVPAKLVVRVAPQRPRIEYNASQVLPGHNLTSLHGEVAVIKCISHYGNPPPILKWFLDQHEITPTRKQTNSTELDNPRTWFAISILELTISKDNNGKTLRCVAVHESYSTKSSSVEVRLDVMYVPETRLVGIPTSDVEEFKDSVAIRCVVNANPKAIVMWKREGQAQPASLQEVLQMSPAVRQHAGLYTCHARNKAGESQPLRVHVDVKYPPKILSVGPDRLTTGVLFTSTTFECIAEGNPQPIYQWLQRVPSPSNRILERGREAKLHITNITYDYQGEYVCKVTNIIAGTERTIQSEAIALQVVGAPQILRHSSTPDIFVEKGEDIELTLVTCSDPKPKVVAWEWGSLRLEAGSEMGRYSVNEVIPEEREDCYLTTLKIKDAEVTDSRAYYLAVENDRGHDRHAIKLYVNEPLQMSTIVTLAGACAAIFFILICMFLYTLKAEKYCFARKGDFKPSDRESLKLGMGKPPTGSGGIPADAVYTTTPRTGRSPEAMKLRNTLIFDGNGSIESRGVMENYYGGITNSNQQPSRQLTLPSPRNCDNDVNQEDHYKSLNNAYRKYTLDVIAPSSAQEFEREAETRSSISYGNNRRFSKNRSSGGGGSRERPRPKPLQADNEKYYEHVFPSKYPRRQSYNDTYYNYPHNLEHAEL